MVHAARIGLIDSPPGKVGTKHRALALRIANRIEDYLRFATDPRAPFDSNAVEREIRMAKLRQKVSGGVRTLSGAEVFAALCSHIATTAKNGIHGLDALTQLAIGGTLPPSHHLANCPGPWWFPSGRVIRMRPRGRPSVTRRSGTPHSSGSSPGTDLPPVRPR